MNRIALFTVFYPGAEAYVDDFFKSIKHQTRTDFDLIIVNDGYKDKSLQNLCPEISIVELEGTNRISTNRELGINYIIDKNYEYLLLCDVDDYFSPNRITKSIKFLSDTDIVVNDLNIVDANRKVLFERYFSKSIDENVVLTSEFIRDKNIFGFSNTALRVSKIHKVTFPEDLRIVDWYYFTNLLNEGLNAKFIPEALTEYRQHSGNMIGIATYTIDMFKNLLQLKIKHYSYFSANPIYKSLMDEMLVIEKMTDDEKESLLANNENRISYPLWWQNVKINK